MLIKEKVKIFTKAFNIQEKNLSFSNEWLHKFKKYNNIHKYHIHGKSKNMSLVSLIEKCIRLQSILDEYTLNQIYNINKMIGFSVFFIKKKCY